MKWTDETTIETPERIDVDLELAGLGSRFVAQLTDWFFKFLMTLALLMLAIISLLATGMADPLVHASRWVQAGFVAVAYFIWLGYDIYFEGMRYGQTPGKKIAGIRVVRDGGGPIDLSAACIRNFLAFADFLPAIYLLGALLIQTTQRKQRLGDMAAGTLVIRERSAAAPYESQELIVEHAASDIVFTRLHLTKCRPGDREVLRSFLQRVESLKPKERNALAQRLADQFAERMEFAEPVRNPTAFLASLYRDLQADAGRLY